MFYRCVRPTRARAWALSSLSRSVEHGELGAIGTSPPETWEPLGPVCTYFDLDSVRVPYKTPEPEIERRRLDRNGRRTTQAGHGRDRRMTPSPGCETTRAIYREASGRCPGAAFVGFSGTTIARLMWPVEETESTFGGQSRNDVESDATEKSCSKRKSQSPATEWNYSATRSIAFVANSGLTKRMGSTPWSSMRRKLSPTNTFSSIGRYCGASPVSSHVSASHPASREAQHWSSRWRAG